MKYKVTFPNEFIVNADSKESAEDMAWEMLRESPLESKIVPLADLSLTDIQCALQGAIADFEMEDKQ